ncbi:MAG: Chromosome partition protein smc, partial [Parcubacteria group bacterium GW2011_GWC1_43_11]
RLEDMGSGTGEDVVKEHDQTIARDEFLAKEIEDLQKSAEALSQLIQDLTIRLGEEFQGGIKKINKQFEEFFALMFGGGTASLLLIKEQKRRRAVDPELEGLEGGEEEEEVEEEEGIEINVNLPHKKIKGLHMLSGGERALTSIALLFAISQVNPPPFLILDETDAALDEANSKKYGNMLENLSKYSQLIVVTHNRETMSRAGILYGVTMGSDAV